MSDERIVSAEEAKAWRDDGVDGTRDEIAYMADSIIALHARVAELTERIARATETRDAAAQSFDALVARVWRAATGDTHEGPASVESLIAAVTMLTNVIESVTGQLCDMTAKHDALRTIIAGRTTPPTDEDLAMHAATGGRWRTAHIIGTATLSRDGMGADEAEHVRAQMLQSHVYRWWALDADRVPCAWPVVGGAR